MDLIWLICILIIGSRSDSLLTTPQRNWLLGVSRGNNSVGSFPEITMNQSRQLASKYDLFLNETIKYHLPYNYAVDIVFSNYNQSQIKEYQDCGDSAIWTANYIAYLAHCWNTTSDVNILNHIYNHVHSWYNLITCAEREGYMVRMVAPANDSAYKQYYDNFDHFYCSDNSPTLNSSWVWLGNESRDQYTGAFTMLTVIWTFVHGSDAQTAEIRNKVVEIGEIMINDLYENDWWIINSAPDWHVPTRPDPPFKLVWMKLAMVFNPSKYIPLLYDEYNQVFKLTIETLEFDISDIYESAYFANNLLIMSLASLTYLETDIEKLMILFNRFQYNGCIKNKIHLQASFSAWFLSNVEVHKDEFHKLNVTQKCLSDAQGLLMGILLDFPDNKWEKYVNQSTNPLYFPHHNYEMSKYALLPYDRPYDTYMWQRSPAKLYGGQNNSYQQYQMTDFLLPYSISKFVKL